MSVFTRRAFAALCGIALLSGVAQAERASATQPIVALYDGLEKAMRAGRTTPFQQRFEALAPVIDKVFDLETILSVSVGLRWASMDDAAKAKLRTVFRQFTIASYVANFDKYDGEKFEVAAATRAQGENQIVASRIVASNGDPIQMDYVMRDGGGVWRVVDVLLDGTISRVAVQRSDFRGLLAKGDPAPLIENLQRKTTELSGGALG